MLSTRAALPNGTSRGSITADSRDDIEQALTTWQDAGRPDIGAVRLQITDRVHTYSIEDNPSLRWEHRLA
ncbi:hypothetical protein ACFVT5_20640 [Streptomyces sp. NPDC058001]|uniref:hypothetical protein n=1 Tax=Streptomyces sp. NPDC058001 TaxID=3346300 RepID=UPI0036E92D01